MARKVLLVHVIAVLATLFSVSVALAQIPEKLSPTYQTAGKTMSLFTSPNQIDGRKMAPDSSLFLPTEVYLTGGQLGWATAIADMNNDGIPDILEVSCCSARKDGNATIGVLIGHGDGTFQKAKVRSSGAWYTYSIVVADLNGDGKQDVVVTSECDSGCAEAGNVVSVLMGKGNGILRPATVYPTGGGEYASGEGTSLPVVVADLNGDGKPDLVVVSQTDSGYGDGMVGVLINNGDGTFRPVVNYDSGGFVAGSFTVADLNGDGKSTWQLLTARPAVRSIVREAAAT